MNTQFNDRLCANCERSSETIPCVGGCLKSFHKECLGLSSMPSGKWNCPDCTKGVVIFVSFNSRSKHRCFQCKAKVSDYELIVCSIPSCRRRYHWKKECCGLNENDIYSETFVCPCHRCTLCGRPEDHQNMLLKCFRCTKCFHHACLPHDIFRLDQRYFKCTSHLSEDPTMPPISMPSTYKRPLSSPYDQPSVAPFSSQSPKNPPNQPYPRGSSYNLPSHSPYQSHSPYASAPINPYQHSPVYAQPSYPQQPQTYNNQPTYPQQSPYPQQPAYSQQSAYPQQAAAYGQQMRPTSTVTEYHTAKRIKYTGPRPEMSEEQKAGRNLLIKWKDLRRAGIELTDKRIKIRSELLEEVNKKRDVQILNTKSMRDKLLAQSLVY